MRGYLETLSDIFLPLNVHVKGAQISCVPKGKAETCCNGLLHTKETGFQKSLL
jgi:hypothetical protein